MFVGILRSPLIFTNENEGLLVWLSPNIFHKNLGDWKAIILSPVVSPPGRGRSPPEQGRTTPPENSNFSQKLNLVTMQDKKQLRTACFFAISCFFMQNKFHLYLGLGLLLLRGLGDLLYLLGLKRDKIRYFGRLECFPPFRYIGRLSVFHLGERPLLGDGLLRLP